MERKKGKVMGKWGKKRKEKKKKRKRKKRKMGCCIALQFGPQKWRWEVGHDGLELVLG